MRFCLRFRKTQAALAGVAQLVAQHTCNMKVVGSSPIIGSSFKKRNDKMKCLNCGKEIKANRKYCNNQCQIEYQHKQYILRWKKGLEDGMRGEYQLSLHIKHYIKEKYNNCCALCGWHETNPYTGVVPLEIHHIDGNYRNNQEDNLILLCPNCHSLTPNFKGANKNGRPERKKYT